MKAQRKSELVHLYVQPKDPEAIDHYILGQLVSPRIKLISLVQVAYIKINKVGNYWACIWIPQMFVGYVSLHSINNANNPKKRKEPSARVSTNIL